MSKILIIPDVHCRNFWRKAVYDNVPNVDKVIFLGDYLDPYQNEIENNPVSMECSYFGDFDNIIGLMLNDILSLKRTNPNKYILLCGNHTCSYIWSNFKAATRTDYKNWDKYHNIFKNNLNLFNLVWIENNVIFSHAGITEGWANNFLYTYMKYDDGAELEKDSSILETARVLQDTPLEDFNKYYIEAISQISFHRFGDYDYGSCEWADLREHLDIDNIIPTGDNEIYQVFGHTQLKKPIINDKWACLDCKKGFIIDTLTHEITEC